MRRIALTAAIVGSGFGSSVLASCSSDDAPQPSTTFSGPTPGTGTVADVSDTTTSAPQDQPAATAGGLGAINGPADVDMTTPAASPTP